MREGRTVKVVLFLTVIFSLTSFLLVLLLGRTCQTNFFTCRAYEGKEQEITSYVLDASRRNINRQCWFRSGYDENLSVMCIFLFVFVTMVAGTELIWNNLSRVFNVDKVLINVTNNRFSNEEIRSGDRGKRECDHVTTIVTAAVADVTQDHDIDNMSFDMEEKPKPTCTYNSLMKVFVFYLLKSVIQLILAYLFALNSFWAEWGWLHLWLGDKKWCWLPRTSAKLELECHPTGLGRTIGFLMITDGALSLFVCIYLSTYIVYLPLMLFAKVSTVRVEMEKHGITSTWKIFSLIFYVWLGLSGNELNLQTNKAGLSTRNNMEVHESEHTPILESRSDSDTSDDINTECA